VFALVSASPVAQFGSQGFLDALHPDVLETITVDSLTGLFEGTNGFGVKRWHWSGYFAIVSWLKRHLHSPDSLLQKDPT
jgi:hypothetical protein